MIDAQQKMTRSLQDFNESFNGIYYPVATLFTNAMTLFYTTLEKVIGYIPGLGPSKPKPAPAPAAAPAGQPGAPAAQPTAPAAAPTNRSTPAAPAAPTGGGTATPTPAPAAAPATQPAAGRTAPAATQAPTQPATESTAPVSLNQAPITTASQQAYSMIESFESFTPRAHWDFKQYSIGYGTRTDDPDEIAGTKTIDRAEARRRLNEHVDKVVPAVVRAGQARQWGQNQIDAITSFAYNMGAGQIRNLTANGNRTNQETADMLPAYNKAGGQKSAGLMRRRSAEQALFLRDMPMMGDGGITEGPSIAGEAGPEAVIPLSDGRVPVDLSYAEDALRTLMPLVRDIAKQRGTTEDTPMNIDDTVREAVEIYMAPNPVEQEILSILQSISKTNGATVSNNQRIYRARAS
jgi:GH24 family phage-related lysozyme (muramidase)